MKKIILVIIVLLISISLLNSDSKNEKSELTVNKEVYKLKYNYASYQNGFFDKGVDDILLILSDIPLKKKLLNDVFKRMKLEKKGKLHCLEITLNWKNMIINIKTRDKSFQFTPSSSNTDFVFEPMKTTKNTIKGRIYSRREQDFLGIKYSFDCTFETKIEPREKKKK